MSGTKASGTKAQSADNSSFIIERLDAVSAKRALQSAYDRIDGVRKTIFGSRANQLDHSLRELSIAITALRDADRVGNEVSITSGIKDLGEKALKRRNLKPARTGGAA